MKKILALALALTMLCAASLALAEPITLQLWSIATESDSSHQAFVDAIAAYEAEHPDIKIEHNATENEAYKTKIKAAMSSGEDLPDIFFTWGMGFLGEFVDAGRVVCLDDYYPAYADELPEAMTVNVRYDNKMFGSMEYGDLEKGLELAKAIGDDWLQKKAQGRATPESFTHGTSDQRKRWLKRGFQTGDMQTSTFSVQNYNDL